MGPHEERDDTMDPFKAHAVLLGLLLVALPLAGCLGVPIEEGSAGGDGDADSSPDRPDDVPPVPEDCWPGAVRNYTWSPLFFSRPDGQQTHTGERVHCWTNWNQTDDDPARVYFVFHKDRGVGEWEITVYDAEGDVFQHKVIRAGEVHCNEEGIMAPMGEWTIVHEWRNMTGAIDARLCLDGPPECFNRCPG